MAERKQKAAAVCTTTGECHLVSACEPGVRMPCVDVMRVHQEELALCDALESIADSLPVRVDRFECLRVGSELAPAIRLGHKFEERYIFPVFADMGNAPGRNRSVDRLKAEHVADECAAADLSEILLRIGHGGEVDNAEALGFMLRALFQGMRRHIAFEREHILPATLGNRALEG